MDEWETLAGTLANYGAKDFGSVVVDGSLVPVNRKAQRAFAAFVMLEATRPLKIPGTPACAPGS